MNKTAAITGGTGALGPSVARALRAAGYEVRLLSRTPPDAQTQVDGAKHVPCSVTEKSAVREAIKDCRLVIHMAAHLHDTAPTPQSLLTFDKTNIEGTRIVVEEAQRAGVTRIVFTSTIAVYDTRIGAVLTEESPTAPDTRYAETKLHGERLVLQAKDAEGKTIGTVLRLSAVYGPRIKGNYLTLARTLAKGRFFPLGNGENRRTLVHEHDAARAIIAAAENPAAAGQIFNVSDGRWHQVSEIIKSISAALNRRAPRWHLPVAPARLAAGLLETVCSLTGTQPPITQAMIAKYLEDIRVSSDKIQSDLSFKPEFDLKNGWINAINEMRRKGTL